jgi:hypothetical protein
MKKSLVLFIIACMLCVSITGAVSSVNIKKENGSSENQSFIYEKRQHISTAQATTNLANVAEKYFNLNEENYNPAEQTLEADAYVPWTGLYKGDILEWYIRLVYNGEEFLQEVPITIMDFQEQFLKHPEYGKTLKFDVDADPEDDILVIIGFYWSIIRYPNGQDYKSLETRLRVRQLSDGGYLDDPDGQFECWSELHVNLGLIQEQSRPRFTFRSFLQNRLENGRFGKFIQQILEKNDFPVLRNLFNKLTEDDGDDFEPLDTDDDYFSIGAGYGSPLGEEIPQLVEKRFSFAKGLRWKDGSIFNPVIFQHMMSPGNNVVGDEIIELLYGFRSYEAASSSLKYDVGFNVEFEPAVNLKTKFIPLGGYLAYFLNIPSGQNWGGWTPRSQPTTISFTADIKQGSGTDLPKLSLIIDKIDDNLAGSSTKWFSFDITGVNGFEYTASHRFNVGIIVDVPGLFTEKVEVKGMPTSLIAKWGIDDVSFIINQNRFYASLGLYSQLTMSSNIDRVTVFYPKFAGSEDAPDSPMLDIKNIPSSQRVDVDGALDLQKSTSNVLTVSVGGGVSMQSSGNIAVATLYYPKADWYNDPDIEFIGIPAGLPGGASASVDASLRVNLDNLMDPNNRIYGNIQHGFNSNVEQVDVFLPSDQDTPIVRFTDIPAFATTRGELYWAQLKGYGFSSRNSQNKDPIEINLLYGDYELYNKLEIRDGQIYTRFHVDTDGYFELDTTKKMFKNDFRFNNYANGDQLLLYVEDVSADDFKAAWDIDTSGEQLEIEDLAFSGIIDTLKGLDIGISYMGKIASFDLDWEVGEQGNFEIEITQEEDLTLDFSDVFTDPNGNWDLNGFITLDNTLSFDMEWKLDMGQSAQDPGYMKINKNSAGDNIKEFELEFIYTNPDNGNEYGIDLYMYQPTFYMDLQWYFDIDDPIPPYVYVWLDLYVGAAIFNGDLIWTNQQGITYYIDLEDYIT